MPDSGKDKKITRRHEEINMKKPIQSEAASLRQCAEELLRKKISKQGAQLTQTETNKLLHELEVHQVELEMQNQELIQSNEQASIATEKYIKLYDFAPTGYFSLSNQGEILELNIAGAKMLGKDRSQLKNRLFHLHLTDDLKSVFLLFLEKVFRRNIVENCEVTLLSNANSQLVLLLTGIASENGAHCFITAVDITERKQTEQELIIAKEHAEQSDRLKSAFLANMGHEIRTPMNGILGFAELLKEPGLTGEQQQQYIDIIEKSGARMLNIINDIVSISKIESGTMDTYISGTNINGQTQYVYNLLKLDAEKKKLNLILKNGLPDKESIIQTDNEKFVGILSNLVKNAIKYTDQGSVEFGYILVEAQGRASLQFYVKDTGIGIPKDRQEAIFERFIQADIQDKMARQGAGLGLAISRAYVKMLGGEIWVESEPNCGSTFYFSIPYNTKIEEKQDKENLSSDREDKTQLDISKVMIVEDDETSTLLIKQMVSKFSKEIFIAKNGLDAINLCRQNPDIDLILMDIQMPVMNGYEATRQIRQFNKDVIIIAQTAFGLEGDREKSIEAGCNDYISKPIRRDEFTGLLQKYFKK
jgi:PAS domain S-box-containing protein